MSTLIGVYENAETAEAVATAIRTTHTADDDVVVDDAVGAELARSAEMDAEVADSWGSPGLGAFVTADQMRGAVLFTIIGGAIGLIPGVVIGLAFFGNSDDVIARVLVGALVGILFGSTVGGLIGGGMAMQSTDRPLAYEAGVPVRVDNATDDVAELMSQFKPLRLDRFEDGQRVETIATAGPHGISGTMRLLRRNSSQPSHRD
jgi:hypothetical protein